MFTNLKGVIPLNYYNLYKLLFSLYLFPGFPFNCFFFILFYPRFRELFHPPNPPHFHPPHPPKNNIFRFFQKRQFSMFSRVLDLDIFGGSPTPLPRIPPFPYLCPLSVLHITSWRFYAGFFLSTPQTILIDIL